MTFTLISSSFQLGKTRYTGLGPTLNTRITKHRLGAGWPWIVCLFLRRPADASQIAAGSLIQLDCHEQSLEVSGPESLWAGATSLIGLRQVSETAGRGNVVIKQEGAFQCVLVYLSE